MHNLLLRSKQVGPKANGEQIHTLAIYKHKRVLLRSHERVHVLYEGKVLIYALERVNKATKQANIFIIENLL